MKNEWRSDPHRSWIFQAEPSRFDLDSAFALGRSDRWFISRFTEIIAPGDVVYFWVSGARGGLFGWGEVTGPVARTADTPDSGRLKDPQPDAGPKKGETLEESIAKGLREFLEVTYRHRFATIIPREDLRQAGGHLRSLTILRNPQGANFRVTTMEAEALNSLIRERGEEPPQDARSSDLAFYSGSALLEYRYSKPCKRVLEAVVTATARYGLEELNPANLLDMAFEFANRATAELPRSLRFLRSRLRPDFRNPMAPIEWTDIAGKLDPTRLPKVRMARSALVVLEAARSAAIRTTHRERIHMRHLVAALLTSDDQGLTEVLRTRMGDYGESGDTLRSAFLEFAHRQWPEDSSDAWGRVIMEPVLSSSTSVALRQVLAKVTGDAPAGIDRLGITPEVNALASLVAASDIEPPFAIGLFGDWGSGKTFFMRKMYERVARIADVSKIAADGEPNAYCRSIIQIWFNAWHYVESNLWASLVDHMFRELRTALKGDTECKEEFQELMKKLGSSKQRALAIQEKLAVAESKMDALKERRDDLIKDKEEAHVRSKGELARKVLDEITDEAGRKQLMKDAAEMEKALGITGFEARARKLDASARSLLGLISESGLAISRVQNLWRSLIAGRFRGRDWGYLALGSAVVAAVVVIVYLHAGDAKLTAAATGLGEFAAFLGVAISWARNQLRRASSVLDSVEGLQTRINTRVREAEAERQARIVALEGEMARLSEEALATEADLREARDEVDRIHAELTATTPERIVQFISERAQSEDYRKHLGLLAMVRQDFEELQRLMDKQRRLPPERRTMPAVDRIVLYIDDLDRCPPERVVQVLQAIHLLLAFPLFMVVVGVDSRWLSRSLKDQYHFLVHEDSPDERPKPSEDPYGATTRDYLEKIFQVPFWLKAINAEQAGNLIDHIVEQDRTPEPAPVEDAGGPDSEEAGGPQRRADMEEGHEETEDESGGIPESTGQG